MNATRKSIMFYLTQTKRRFAKLESELAECDKLVAMLEYKLARLEQAKLDR